MSDFDFTDTLKDLDAGIFSSKLSRAVQDVAQGVIAQGKVGMVTIELKMVQLGDTRQIQIDHKLKYDKPTTRGNQTETDKTSSMLYVNASGSVTLMPDTQETLQFDKEDA